MVKVTAYNLKERRKEQMTVKTIENYGGRYRAGGVNSKGQKLSVFVKEIEAKKLASQGKLKIVNKRVTRRGKK